MPISRFCEIVFAPLNNTKHEKMDLHSLCSFYFALVDLLSLTVKIDHYSWLVYFLSSMASTFSTNDFESRLAPENGQFLSGRHVKYN